MNYELTTYTQSGDFEHYENRKDKRYFSTRFVEFGDEVDFIITNKTRWDYVRAKVKYAFEDNSLLVELIEEPKLSEFMHRKGDTIRITIFECYKIWKKSLNLAYQLSAETRANNGYFLISTRTTKYRGKEVKLGEYKTDAPIFSIYLDMYKDYKHCRKLLRNIEA